MESVVPALYASARQPLPFAPSSDMRAFLCRREHGNLLIYSTSELASETQAIEALGGISRQYLNHRHEAAFTSESVMSPLFVHEKEHEPVAEKTRVDGTFTARHMLDDDFEVIPTPGHTPGATSFLWDSGRHRLLFTGDTIYLSEGEWVAAVLDSSDRDRYIASLELIRELDFDVLVPWNATGGQPSHAMTDRSDARRRIDAILKRIRRGENR
jgi:glyoxylase-like metal-dependent hydrolase (beta-lactamase superfamily II)